jgi:hypothetical protein
MARTAQDLEAYLTHLGRPFEERDACTYILSSGPNAPPVVVRAAPPVVVFRADIGGAPEAPETRARVFARLLEINARDLAHASYGLSGGQIVLTATLELDNLDLNEVEAVLADIDLAVATQVPEIRKLY